MKQNAIAFDYKKGDEITIEAANLLITQAYQKFNELVDENIRSLTTGSITGDGAKRYPNYCGWMLYDEILAFTYRSGVHVDIMDAPYKKLITEADSVLGGL